MHKRDSTEDRVPQEKRSGKEEKEENLRCQSIRKIIKPMLCVF